MNSNHSAFQGDRIILSDLNKNRVECSVPVSPHENAYIKTQNLCLEEQENMPVEWKVNRNAKNDEPA